jgi:four helix bundle protein
LTKGEFQQFLGHSRGSLLELETQMEIAADLNYVKSEDFNKLILEMSEVRRLLNGLIESLRVRKTSLIG